LFGQLGPSYVRKRLCVPLHVSEQSENDVHDDHSHTVQLLSFVIIQPFLHVYVVQGSRTLLSPLTKVVLSARNRHGQS
jgi:hypothetical protein